MLWAPYVYSPMWLLSQSKAFASRLQESNRHYAPLRPFRGPRSSCGPSSRSIAGVSKALQGMQGALAQYIKGVQGVNTRLGFAGPGPEVGGGETRNFETSLSSAGIRSVDHSTWASLARRSFSRARLIL